MTNTIYLTPKCDYENFILDNLICKPLVDDLIFKFLIFIVFGFFIFLVLKEIIFGGKRK